MVLSTSRVINFDGIKGEVLEDKYNGLIGRRELTIRVDHILKSTPSRLDIRVKLSRILNVDIERIYVRSIKTEYGVGISIVIVHIYDTTERAKVFEPEHIVRKNGGLRPEGV
ncbi:MAG: 30S ribosomal protein S24e [Acidilobaceae archaeon]